MSSKSIIRMIAAASAAVIAFASCTKYVTLEGPKVTAQCGSHSIELNWTEIANASGYSIAYIVGEETKVATTTETSLTVSNLKSNTSYQFAIKANGSANYLDSETLVYEFSTTAEVTNFDITVSDCSYTGLNLNFKVGADVATAEVAVVSQFKDINKAIKEFQEGTLPTGHVEFSGTEKTVQIEATQAGAPVVIIAQGKSIDGAATVLCTKTASFAPINLEISNISLGSFVVKVAEVYDQSVPFVGVIAMSQDAPAEWGATAEEIVTMYAEWGMIDMNPAGESFMVELNGDPNFPHYIGIVYFDVTYSVSAVKILDYTSGELIEGAPEARVEVSADNVTATSVSLNFKVNENTCGYFYKLYKKADYDAAIEQGKKYEYENPEDYVRELVAAGGSMDYKTMTEDRTGLKSGTDYILVCFPYNINGNQGYGPTAKVEFKTGE